jgi:hypothetical protein
MADLTQLRADIDESLRTRRFLDCWESSEWASEATPVVDAIRDALAASPSAELLGLIQRAVGHVIKVILGAADSNGEIGGLAAELLEFHGLACDAGVADPVKLARWMVRFTVDDQDFFVLDPKRYSDALGETGLAVYRKEIDRRRRAGEQPFALRYVDERLAVLDGDVDKIIRLLGGNLTSPYQFIQVTEAMVELGRDDDALAWAQRGIAETGGWQVAQLYDLAAGVYVRRGALGEVVALRWDQHRRMTSSTTYALLREAAEATGGWDPERSSARSVLEAEDLGGLVDALLADGETEAAWRVADDHPDWNPGRRRWKRLAESRESSHPADAMAVYFKLADFELETTGRSSYTRAAALLKKARRAADLPVVEESSQNIWPHYGSNSVSDRLSSRFSIGPHFADRQDSRSTHTASQFDNPASSRSPAATASIVVTASSVGTSSSWPLSTQNIVRHPQARRLLPSSRG